MDIIQSPSGKIIRSLKGYTAFVPHPLPPKIEWNNHLVNSLSRANYLLGKLAREGSLLPNPHLLIRPFITKEAVLSSQIEGTQASISEILEAESHITIPTQSYDIQEVNNYIKALEYGINRLEEFPLSLRLIKEIHEQLMQGVRGSHATPGEFRHSQNWIGSPGCTLNTAKFVPPPPDYLMESLGHFESFLHNREWPSLIHIALCHYQLEAIHPFLDGNGRIGRLLIVLLLIEQKLLPSPILYLSAFFEATRNEYYRLLYSVSKNGTWEEWLIYFLNGIAIQSEDVLSRAERINHLLAQWKLRAAETSSSVALRMIDQLAMNPFLTTKKTAVNLEVAYTTAQRGIQKLEALNIIKKINTHKRDVVYCATEILNILEEPTKINANHMDM